LTRWLPVILCLVHVASAAAQRAQPELRVDAIGPSPYAVQAGAGIIWPLGTYIRASVGAGFGARTSNGATTSEWRGDLLARATLDPFRQQRWALSVGGGLTLRRRLGLALVVDLEGPEGAGWVPALQVGVGGGARAGLALRRAMKGRR
jgi:hypothetical protein